MPVVVAFAFAAGFLLVFGLNLLYSSVQSERRKSQFEAVRQEGRARQMERARLAAEHRDLFELAAAGATDLSGARPASERLALFFEQAGVKLRPWQIVVLGIVFGLGAYAAIGLPTRNWLFGLIATFLCGLLPYVYVVSARRRRLDKLLSQLPDAFDLISRMMRAGQTFSQGMQLTANEASAPLADEFGYCCDQQRLGLSPDAALRDLARRTGLLEVRIFVLAVTVHRQTGGNLAELLEQLAQVIRERYRVRGIINALTAEGRIQAYLLLALPVLMLVLLTIINRTYTQRLFEHPWLLVLTAVSMLVGGVWMRRIINFDH
jgi:tight adherence protein B